MMITTTLEGIKDLFEDFSGVARSRMIDLKHIKIYQEKSDNVFLCTNVNDLSQKNIKVNLNDLQKAALEETKGLFYLYEKDNKKVFFLFSNEVQSRRLGDYLKIYDVDSFTSKDNARQYAKALSELGNIGFFYKKTTTSGFNFVTGVVKDLKYYVSINEIIDMISPLMEDSVCRIDYNEEDVNKMFFSFEIESPFILKNDTRLYIRITDAIGGRKPILIDLICKDNNDEYIIDALEVRHNAKDLKEIQKELQNKIDKILEVEICSPSKTVDYNKLLNVLSLKSKDIFINQLGKSGTISSACKIIKTNANFFNLKEKVHQTPDYDGGRRKYELQLGKMLLNNV